MSQTAAGRAETPKPDSGYFKDAAKWEGHLYRWSKMSATAWRSIAFLAILVCAGLVAVILMMLPLRQLEVVTLLVDKTTGFVEVARPLSPDNPLHERDSVTMANIVRYLRARETYDPKALNDNFELAVLYSSGQALKDLQAQWAPSNDNSPQKVLGANANVSVLVKSISMLNAYTASIRFQTTTTRNTGTDTQHWVANVRFKYTTEPYEQKFRFDNPLGFKIFEYRRDQETVDPTDQKGASQ